MVLEQAWRHVRRSLSGDWGSGAGDDDKRDERVELAKGGESSSQDGPLTMLDQHVFSAKQRKFVKEVLAGRRPISWVLLGLVVLGLGLCLLLLLVLLLLRKRGGGPPRYVLWEQSSGGIHADTPSLVSVPQDTFFLAKTPRSLCSYAGTGLPLGVAEPLRYNLTLYLEQRHFAAEDALQMYEADVAITLAVNQTTNCLVLHCAGLDFHQVWASDPAGQSACSCGETYACPSSDCSKVVRHISGTEMCLFDLGSTVLSGGTMVFLHATYTAHFSPELGLYRSAVFNYWGGSSALVLTQLQQEGARRLLPCFDHINFKAEFEVAVQYPNNMKALSTMAEEGTRDGDKGGTLFTKFKRTPQMSPHLLAICVGLLEGKGNENLLGFSVSAWATPDLKWQLDTPLTAASGAVGFYASYVGGGDQGVEQPIRQFNLVAVPGKTGATQTWGLLLFDEDRFLVHPGSEGAYGEWVCADVVCHQMAHQWFGNLATAPNWAESTVMEGLATFLEYKCIEAAFPLMNGPAFFHIATSPMNEWLGVHEGPRHLAMTEDEDAYLAPLVPQLNAKGVAFQASTPRTTYSKGAAFLGMLEAYWEALLPNSFQVGLRLFVHRHAFKTASTEDLLTALLDTLHQSLSKTQKEGLMDLPIPEALKKLSTWLRQPGIPLLVVKDERDNVTRPRLFFQQQRFSTSGKLDPQNKPWYIPVPLGNLGYNRQLKYDESEEHEEQWSFDDESWIVVDGAAASVKVEEDQQQDLTSVLDPYWIANKDGLGLYRTAYSKKHVGALVAHLSGLQNPAEHHVGDVIQVAKWAVGPLRESSSLLEDALPLAYSGNLDMPSVLQLYQAAAGARAAEGGMGKYLLLLPVLNAIERLQGLLHSSESCLVDLSGFVATILRPHTEQLAEMVSRSGKVGSISEQNSQANYLGRIIRPKVLLAAALHGDTAAVGSICTLFQMHYNDKLDDNQVEADLRGAVYIVATAHPEGCQLNKDREQVWDLMRDKWESEADLTESRRGLFALAYTRDDDRLQRTVELVLDPRNATKKSISFTDRLALLRILSASAPARRLLWPFFVQNWQLLTQKYGPGVWQLLKEAGQPLVSEQLQELDQFFKSHVWPVPPVGTREHIRSRLIDDLNWIKDHQLETCLFLQNARGQARSW